MSDWYIKNWSSDEFVLRTTIQTNESSIEISASRQSLGILEPYTVNENAAKIIFPAYADPKTEVAILMHAKQGIEEILKNLEPRYFIKSNKI